MLQGLLAERFKMKAHWETREGDVYNLVVAKGGSRMGAAGSLPVSAEEKERFGDHPVPPLSLQRCDGQGCDLYWAWVPDGSVGEDDRAGGASWAGI